MLGREDSRTQQTRKARTGPIPGRFLTPAGSFVLPEAREAMLLHHTSCVQVGVGGCCRGPRLFSCQVALVAPVQEAQQCEDERRALGSPDGKVNRSRERLEPRPRPLNRPKSHPSQSLAIIPACRVVGNLSALSAEQIFRWRNRGPWSALPPPLREVADGGRGRPVPDAGEEVEAYCQDLCPTGGALSGSPKPSWKPSWTGTKVGTSGARCRPSMDSTGIPYGALTGGGRSGRRT